jgi:hypothetical protein
VYCDKEKKTFLNKLDKQERVYRLQERHLIPVQRRVQPHLQGGRRRRQRRPKRRQERRPSADGHRRTGVDKVFGDGARRLFAGLQSGNGRPLRVEPSPGADRRQEEEQEEEEQERPPSRCQCHKTFLYHKRR